MLFRNRRLARVTACYLLLQTISSLVFPTVSLAMMGPSQPEFTSYEAPGATDLVNLVTGDLTYSMPVLDIPGPERSFSLPLTYKAGIQLEQEASWVGLGWSLNAGAIARSVNGYADDANNEPTQTTFNKRIDRGWNSSFLGVINLGWNSVTGHNGSVDLIGLASVGWNEDGINRGDLVGVGYTAGQGISVDPVRMAMAAVTIATLGGGSAMTIAGNIGIEMGTSVPMGVAMSAVGLGHLGGVTGYNNSPTRNVESHLWGDNYWNFFSNNTTENAFGSLYFNKMSQNTVDTPQLTAPNSYNYDSPPPIKYGAQTAVSNTAKIFKYARNMSGDGNVFSETAADIYQDATIRDKQLQVKTSPDQILDPAQLDAYYNTDASRRPISVAHDYFSVMGESVSGTIRPYRLDVGSVAYPKAESNVIQEYYGGSNPTLLLPHYKHMAVPFIDNKVGFRYENSLSNGYDGHRYTPSGTEELTGFSLNSSQGDLVVTDPRLLTTRTAPARKGLYDATSGNAPHLVTGKHVIWYSNSEIQTLYNFSTNGFGNGFLEFEHPTATTLPNGAATNNRFRALAPPSGIGAFAVTAEDGSTYHYSLPVYQYQTYSESNEVSTSVGELGKMTRRTGTSTATNPTGGQATAWLLTAITSADYIDRNNSGTVDAEDWGGWVKFEYGKFSSRYKWRQPYIGTAYSDESATITSRNFTEGYKETYYLNAISTRSHTALFIKGVRQDGRGHFCAGITATSSPASNLGIDERQPASSLRLDEVVLLDNASLAKLRTPDGIRAAGDPTAVPALTNATGSNAGTYPDDPMGGSGDDMTAVLDVHDVDADGRIRKFLNANALKRIHFNYGYDLCRGIPNSFQCQNGQPASLPAMTEAAISDNRGGKLTLKSVSFFGPTVNDIPTKITPDFTFSYESPTYDASTTNPGYGKEKWDAFGLYQSGGRADVTSHKPQGAYGYAAPWSLNKITSPLGGSTEIQYERDQYAHVSEYGSTKIHLSNTNCSSTFTFSYPNGGVGGNVTSLLQPGQLVYLTGTAKYSECVTHKDSYYPTDIRTPTDRFYQHEPFRVSTVSNTQITLTVSPNRRDWLSHPCQDAVVGLGADFDMALPNNVTGGDIRVAALTTREGTNAYQVRYKYVTPTAPDGSNSWYNSTGVLAKEPPFLGRFDHPLDEVFDYPSTSVLYSQVSVLRGLFRNNNDADYETREVYSFHTPVSTMVSETVPDWKYLSQGGGYNNPQVFTSVSANASTRVDVGKVGQPQKVEIYNRRGERELSTDFTYASTISNADGLAGQGHYTEGVLNTERVLGLYRVHRSTKEYVPAVLVGSRSSRNNLTISNGNVLYDFLTGQVLETVFTNSLSKVLHSRSVPAYTLPGNEGMGTKGDNAANKQMLSQQGAFYTYMEVTGGPAYNPLNPLNPATSHILSAGVQTWQKNWTNYREADANGSYQDVAGQSEVWRQAATYTWQSPVLDTDGSFKNFTPFNWTGAPDNRWLKTGETVRYDHYSHAVEARDVNGNYATQKTGYNQTQLIASASNARYTEIAYSGAEDQLLVAGSTQFGGEVAAAGGTPASAPVHTGFYSLSLPSRQQGFLYRSQVGRDIDVDKTYRLSVWANSNATNGKLYVALNGNRLATSTIAAATTKKAGDWYLLSLLYKVPASASGQTLEFGCANDGGTAVNFDDFRVAPLTATLTSRVYDPRTNQLLYSLDNDNLFTHYEYTPTGRLRRVFQETLDGTGGTTAAQKLVKEYDYNYAQLYFPTWVSQVYQCQVDGQGNNTGYEERQEVDVNPLSKAPGATRWVTNGYSNACALPAANCDGAPVRYQNNTPECAIQDGQPECSVCSGGGYSTVLHWRYKDGTPAPDTFIPCGGSSARPGPSGPCNPGPATTGVKSTGPASLKAKKTSKLL